MTLPDLSNSMYVAYLRHIQSIHEPRERRNPDTLVRRFLPLVWRLRIAWIGQAELAKLRADPFYYYLIARTKYYDQVVQDAVGEGAKRLIGVGCGSDTRAYRFRKALCRKGVAVLECDQADAIAAKQRLVRRWRRNRHVTYLPLDLNDSAWPSLEAWLGDRTEAKALVYLEGVSPYIDEQSFRQFLQLLASTLPSGSQVAYDFKVRGIRDDFGREGRTHMPFRMPSEREGVIAYHRALGFSVEHVEFGPELSARFLPGLEQDRSPSFEEDGLVRLRVA